MILCYSFSFQFLFISSSHGITIYYFHQAIDGKINLR